MKIPYFEPWITKEDRNSVDKALQQRWLTNGPFLQKFETNLSKYLKCKFVSGVGSATHALHLSLRAVGIQPNDEVIVPTFTFVATANAAIFCGAKPVLADVDYETFTILSSQIEKKISKKTKAIIAVHYGGQSCDMTTISRIAKKHGIFLIEDCAHALGSKYKNRYCGTIGDAGCFSFYPTKIITTGEGGALTTNNSKIFKKANILRSQAMDISPVQREKQSEWAYDIVDLGYNYRMDEMRAALGNSQIKRIELINKLRKKIAELYNNKLGKIKGIHIPHVASNRNHIYHLYTIKIEKEYHLTRDELFIKLRKNGIGSSVQYTPIHRFSFYKNNFKLKNNNFPNSEKLKNNVLSLPIFPKMTKKQVDKIASIIAS